jgi:phosphatidylserine/phosphatidylglycerophosphate/cardiolipin synthase-like enzyme
LASLPLPVLENALKAMKSGAVLVPVSEAALRAVHLEPLVPHLPALAVFTTQAALCGVFELLAAHARAEAARPRPEIVWSGPQTVHERSRQTAVVFRELLESAKRHIFIAGYSFDGGAHLTGLAHAAMRERNVKCEIVIDCSGVRIHDDPSPANVLARCLANFWQDTWPFGDPRPTLYYDPRTLERVPSKFGDGPLFPPHSMHAKCLIVDESHALVGSANFTTRAEDRNLELGLLLHDPTLIANLTRHWRTAIHEGGVVRV